MTIQHPRFQVSRASKGVKVAVWWKCLYSAHARSLRRRSVLVTDVARPAHAKWSDYYGAHLCSKYKSGFTPYDTLYPLKTVPLPGYWDTDHDRPRTRNTRHSNAQCIHICISKFPTFSLRTSILIPASVSLAPHLTYTTPHIGKKTPVAPLCEWILCSASSGCYTRILF